MKKKRILIIDDEASFTRLLNLNLGCTGKYAVRAENNPPEGLAAVREFHPDLILLDVMMPQMDGGTLAAQLQSDSRFRQIPIVFLTAAVRKDEVDRKSTRLNSSHGYISYAVFCLKKKNKASKTDHC